MERKSDLQKAFTERFDELREGRSNTEFAEFLGISRQTVGFFLNGDRLPDYQRLSKIAERCEVSTDWLMGRSNFKRDALRGITLEDLGFTEKAAANIYRLNTVVSLLERGNLAAEKLYDSRIYYSPEALNLLVRLLEREDFVAFLHSAAAYISSGLLLGNQPIEIDSKEIKLSVPAETFNEALWITAVSLLRNIVEEFKRAEDDAAGEKGAR